MMEATNVDLMKPNFSPEPLPPPKRQQAISLEHLILGFSLIFGSVLLLFLEFPNIFSISIMIIGLMVLMCAHPVIRDLICEDLHLKHEN